MKIAPVLVLFLLSPIIGEVLSGSTPLLSFINPVVLLLEVGLYGCGAVIVRELAIRWQKGLPTVLTLGAAYGIIEEGLDTKSWFNPNWPDVGILGTYGRVLGVNWVWAVELTIYHAVFSIAIPILLLSLLFPSRRSEPWVGKKALAAIGLLFIADVLIGFLDFPYSPPPVQFALTIIGVGVLVVVGKYLPSYSHQLTQSKAARPFKFLIVGALGTIIFFLLSWLAPSTGIPAALNILAIIVWTSLVGALVLRLSGYGRSWRERHLVSLISGGLSFFVFLDFILELNTSGAKDYTGQAFVGIAFVGFLVWLYKATGKREMTSALEPQSSLVIH